MYDWWTATSQVLYINIQISNFICFHCIIQARAVAMCIYCICEFIVKRLQWGLFYCRIWILYLSNLGLERLAAYLCCTSVSVGASCTHVYIHVCICRSDCSIYSYVLAGEPQMMSGPMYAALCVADLKEFVGCLWAYRNQLEEAHGRHDCMWNLGNPLLTFPVMDASIIPLHHWLAHQLQFCRVIYCI